MNLRKMTHWSTARKENGNLKRKTTHKQVNAGIRGCGFVFSFAVAGRGAVGGEGQTDPVRLKSSSQSRTRQAVSKRPADSSVCLSEVSSSFPVSPRLLAEVDITHRGNKCASRSRCSLQMQIRATKAQMYL